MIRHSNFVIRHSPPRPAGPLLVWTAIQLAALALAVFQVRLSANWPQAGERLALQEMIVVQVVASAVLFPYLMRDVSTAVLVIAAAVPFLSLATYLSAQPDIMRQLAGTAGVVVWLAGLACWRAVLGTPRRQFWGAAVATALAVGGPVLWYVRADLGSQDADAAGVGFNQIDWRRDAPLGPVMATLAIASRGFRVPTAWAFLGGWLVLPAAVGVIQWRRRRDPFLSYLNDTSERPTTLES